MSESQAPPTRHRFTNPPTNTISNVQTITSARTTTRTTVGQTSNSAVTQGSVTSAKTQESQAEERPVWDNQCQFILSTLGLSVGLGNIWGFPYVAYKNGGSAFLIPYILLAVLFALPLMYLEFNIGQYTSSSPALAFRKYAPAFEGLGLAMTFMASLVAVFYSMIIAWAAVYFAWIVIGKQYQWTTCDNSWNTFRCLTSVNNTECRAMNSSLPYFNGTTCVANGEAVSAAEEFFSLQLIDRSTGFGDFGGVRWQTMSALLVIWIIVYLVVVKGVKYIGYTSYVTATVPYVIIGIMFVRGVTLDGASEGIYFYLGAPDWSKLLSMNTWLQAVKQLLFSLSIGYGPLIALASYNKLNNNSFRSAAIVVVGDTFMSVFGGVAVFSTLGYLAKQMGVPVDKAVTAGPALTFIAYPEAMSRMPLSSLWGVLFFLMLLLLGLSTEIALVEGQCSSIYDRFPKARKRKWLAALIVCIIYFIFGSIFATGCGPFWMDLYTTFVGTTGTCILVALEALAIGGYYGFKNYRKDLIAMFGAPTNRFTAIFGATSPYWGVALISICPVIALVIGGSTVYDFIEKGTLKETITNENGEPSVYVYPIWAMVFGWCLNLAPLLAIPILFYKNFRQFRLQGKGFIELFRVQPDHRSYARINQNVSKHPENNDSEAKNNPANGV